MYGMPPASTGTYMYEMRGASDGLSYPTEDAEYPRRIFSLLKCQRTMQRASKLPLRGCPTIIYARKRLAEDATLHFVDNL